MLFPLKASARASMPSAVDVSSAPTSPIADRMLFQLLAEELSIPFAASTICAIASAPAAPSDRAASASPASSPRTVSKSSHNAG